MHAAFPALPAGSTEGTGRSEGLPYYRQMLAKHIDLVERRLIGGEKIPHAEKVFSIFQPWSELRIKGKRRPRVEISKNLAVTTDQCHVIVDWQIMDHQTDSKLTVTIARRILSNYSVESLNMEGLPIEGNSWMPVL